MNKNTQAETLDSLNRKLSELTFGGGKGYPSRGSKRMLACEEIRLKINNLKREQRITQLFEDGRIEDAVLEIVKLGKA